MILVHGKIESIELEYGQENSEVVLALTDGTQHRYLYEDNKLFFIVLENGNEEKKFITLCENIDNCTFSYRENRLYTSITIGEITYNNIF